MPESITLTLKERKNDYEAVYSLVFDPQGAVSFEAGQYAHFRIPTLSREELPVREFSFASAPEDQEIVITVNTRSGSAYQKALLALTPGEQIELFKIRGQMTAPEEGTNVVCICHGVGAAPFRSILRHLEKAGKEADATLVQINREAHLYQKEFEGKSFAQHRITREEANATLAEIIEVQASARYLVAGSPTFVVETEDKLKALGIPPEQIARDAFNGLEE